MKKYKGVIIASVLLLAAFLIVTGCNQKQGAEDYFPMGVGSYWEYNLVSFMENDITKMGKEIMKVTRKERVGDVESFVVERYALEGMVPSIGQYREFLVKTEKGVECTKRAFPPLQQAKMYYPNLKTEIVHTPSEFRFKTNLKEGDKWNWEGTMILEVSVDEKATEAARKNNTPPPDPTQKEIKGNIDYKYLGRETIRVMNKDYDCIKLGVFSKNDGGEEAESTIWYAPGIGRVREEQTYFQGSKKVLNLFELSSYNITNYEPFKKK